jgi:hypothetical protein
VFFIGNLAKKRGHQRSILIENLSFVFQVFPRAGRKKTLPKQGQGAAPEGGEAFGGDWRQQGD